MTLVVDASVVIKWFVQENQHEDAIRFLEHASDLLAPDLLVAEVANVVWKKCMRKEIDANQAQIIVSAIPNFIAEIQPSTHLAERALEIALALNHSVYDCLYIACAEKADGVLVTADARLFNKTRNTEFEDRIRLLGDLEDLPSERS